jgi:hypothetical protein
MIAVLDNFLILIAVADSVSLAVRHRITRSIAWLKTRRTILPLLGARAGARADVIAVTICDVPSVNILGLCILSRHLILSSLIFDLLGKLYLKLTMTCFHPILCPH